MIKSLTVGIGVGAAAFALGRENAAAVTLSEATFSPPAASQRFTVVAAADPYPTEVGEPSGATVAALSSRPGQGNTERFSSSLATNHLIAQGRTDEMSAVRAHAQAAHESFLAHGDRQRAAVFARQSGPIMAPGDSGSIIAALRPLTVLTGPSVLEPDIDTDDGAGESELADSVVSGGDGEQHAEATTSGQVASQSPGKIEESTAIVMPGPAQPETPRNKVDRGVASVASTETGSSRSEHNYRKQKQALEELERYGVLDPKVCPTEIPGQPTVMAGLQLRQLGSNWGANPAKLDPTKNLEKFSSPLNLDYYRGGEMWGTPDSDGGYWVHQFNGGVAEGRFPLPNRQFPSQSYSVYKGSAVPFTYCGGKIFPAGDALIWCGRFDVASANLGLGSAGFELGFSLPKLTGAVEYIEVPRFSGDFLNSRGIRGEASIGLGNLGLGITRRTVRAAAVFGRSVEIRDYTLPVHGLSARELDRLKCEPK